MTTAELFKKIETERILIIGDVMIDAYMWGTVTRISPEAPVPVVAITERSQRLGGAANVALNVRAMGATPIICTVVGNDDYGRDFQELMYNNEMDRRGVIASDSRITTVKSRVIGNNSHLVRVDEEDTHPLSTVEEDELLSRVTRIMKTMPIDAIILQDYDKGVITPRIIDEVTSLARRKKVPITVDPKHRNFSHFHDVTLFKPNLKELREGLNVEIDDSSMETLQHDLAAACAKIHQTQHNDIILTTLSNRGMYACDFRSGTMEETLVPAKVRSISDISGAGDTVISVITLALAAGMNLKESVRCANLAGGIVCEQVGVIPIDRVRLEREMTEATE